MLGRPHEHARLQSDFYRDCYYNVLNFLFVEIIVMFLLIGALIFILLEAKKPVYYATTLGGQMIPLEPK